MALNLRGGEDDDENGEASSDGLHSCRQPVCSHSLFVFSAMFWSFSFSDLRWILLLEIPRLQVQCFGVSHDFFFRTPMTFHSPTIFREPTMFCALTILRPSLTFFRASTNFSAPTIFRAPIIFRALTFFRAPITFRIPRNFYAPTTFLAPTNFRMPTKFLGPTTFHAPTTFLAPTTFCLFAQDFSCTHEYFCVPSGTGYD